MSSKPPSLQGRRNAAKQLPRLPLSVFTPPNTGTSDKFPLPPSPSAVHPSKVIDAHVVGDPELGKWQKEIGEILGSRIYGVVLSALPDKISAVPKEIGNVKVVSATISFSPDDIASASAATEAASESAVPVSFSTVFTRSTPESVAALQHVLEKGRPVDIEISVDGSLGDLEEFLLQATKDTESANIPPVILSNILPPPHDFGLPIVKLMNNPSYRAYQEQTATLSLFPFVYVKYIPPVWGVATPSAPEPGATIENSGAKEQREWKRRIKMYLGPSIEAFGYERILFGSSSPRASSAASVAGDWYAVAREAIAEIGMEQEAMDCVFSANAEAVYGRK
ncbi:hypothetical protein AGABI2DRAFT_192709 [Agaricus bisporus var. bisporus H97]|uniref:hypothetical protein n=1 Tax=Agaricus bisporus var. bisporus (strain H97 / ATCC MYA-4626 / FGSC 10389) TaxID=936046 RepID=UPI00029F68E2|nr:hypothetical protein AGABI2DRAFT_192709 [Agaricus bisporus var. bisporus H97]EKV47527.1 hypothetical protein AGABI2DRAFT_192709 [Agaricus bisporus var. bisporus H97]